MRAEILPYRDEPRCRLCDGTRLNEIHHFGITPAADRLVARDAEMFPAAPLTLVQCADCGLAQLRETVDPSALFDADYPYFSSISPSLGRHFKKLANDLIERHRPKFVLEAASNDGYLLQHFQERGIQVQGIDPSELPAERAVALGIPTMLDFFGEKTAERFANQVDLFLANNVLAHVADLNGFVRGIHTVLKSEGRAVIEVPDAAQLVRKLEFDTIYHQHLCYFTESTLHSLFARHEMHIERIEPQPVHGGTLRVTVKKGLTESPDFTELDWGSFSERIKKFVQQFEAITSQRSLVGYGAAAKATTFLHATGLRLPVIADANAHKQGLAMPGSGIPIVAPNALTGDEEIVILAWNFAEEIMQQYPGRKFVIPLPELRII